VTKRNYDPELAAIVPQLPVTSDWSDLPAARRAMEELIQSLPRGGPSEAQVRFTDRQIAGPADAPELTVRVYEPASVSAPLPAVLYLHGGGFCFGSIESEHAGAMATAQGAGTLVVSVEYRLAPEHPVPAAIEDGYAALCWLAAEAPALGVDPARIAR
jgi:acetyl esterase/lipase